MGQMIPPDPPERLLDTAWLLLNWPDGVSLEYRAEIETEFRRRMAARLHLSDEVHLSAKQQAVMQAALFDSLAIID